MSLLAALAMVALAPSARSETCPAALERVTRLVFVTPPTMDRYEAPLRMFERASPAERWRVHGAPHAAVVGKRGIAWGHPFVSYAQGDEAIKHEGDLRTPAGIYRLGATFGIAKDNRPGYLHLVPGANFCVDDPRSRLYGHIVPRRTARKASGEDMAASPLNKRGIVIEYPPDRKAKAGSCIFVHIRGDERTGTGGGVALPEEQVAELQNWIRGRQAAIAIVTQVMAARFGRCLPSAESARKSEAPAAKRDAPSKPSHATLAR